MLTGGGRHLLKALARAYITNSRSYSTLKQPKLSLYSKLSPLGNHANLAVELDNWIQNGNTIKFAQLHRIVLDLRKRRRYAHALQISEWAKSRGNFTFRPAEHAVMLDLICKVQGIASAENYFNGLSEEDRSEKAYGALLHCYVQNRQIDEALALLQKMKDQGLPLSASTFSNFMSFYTKVGEYDKVPDLFNQMKTNGIQPDNLCYRICMNSYGARSDIAGLEKVFSEMANDVHIVMDWITYATVANYYIKAGLKRKANVALEKAEELLDRKNSMSYNHLISLHGRLGHTGDVLRLWNMQKVALKKQLNKDYLTMLESLMRLGELNVAEQVLKEWILSGNCYDKRVSSLVVVGYIEKGLCEKAEAILTDLVEVFKEQTCFLWGRLVVGYVENGKFEKALESLKVALSFHEQVKLDEHTIGEILSLFCEKGSCAELVKVLSMLKAVVVLKREIYHSLLKSYVKGGKEVDRLLDAMKADGFVEDEETSKILSLKNSKSLGVVDLRNCLTKILRGENEI